MELQSPQSSAEPLHAGTGDDRRRVELLHQTYGRLSEEISKTIVGQRHVVELLLTALFAGGHSILVGVPGLAKTLLVSTLARLLSLSFKRIQFTPDLMPSDITGTDVLEEDPESGVRSFRFFKGPVFTNMLLADEINRTPPKTQAALLEAMQERHVTVGDQTMALPAPFLVVATQNPIEQEGTYNLPEAQLDRFLFSIHVTYPSEEDELEIMKEAPRSTPGQLDPIVDAREILDIQEIVPRVPAADHVLRFALALVRGTRPEEKSTSSYVKERVTWGAGPRAAQYLVQAARARALLHGRFHATTKDVEEVAGAVLAHRIVTNFHSNAEGITGVDIVARLLRDTPRRAAEPLG